MQITMLVALLIGHLAAQGTTTNSSLNQLPVIGPSEVWVTSIPIGAMVYVSADDSSGVTSDETFVGRTPVLLKSKPRYVTLAIDFDVVRKALSIEYIMTPEVFLDVTAISSRADVKVDAAGHAAFYNVRTYEPDYSKRKTLVATFQPKDVSLDRLASIYPTGTNFRFDDSGLKQHPLLQGIERSELDGAIRLLHRGGKVALERQATVIVIEVTGVDLLEVTSLHR